MIDDWQSPLSFLPACVLFGSARRSGRQHRYGWNAQRPDQRDIQFLARWYKGAGPQAVNLQSGCPPVYDQGNLGSCTANAIAAAVGFERNRLKLPYLIPSRLFIYYNERALEGTTRTDAGANIRDGFKTIAAQGVCSEWRWPYDKPFEYKPSQTCYAAAVSHKTLEYLSIAQETADMLDCLAQGFPFVFGVTVYESFESEQADATGIIPMPKQSESVLGGHALLAIGYNQATQRFRFRNSWGTSWGQAGYGEIPFAYLANPDLASDFWTVRLEE